MTLNPFLNVAPVAPRAVAGNQKMHSWRAIAQDVQARTGKVQHVKAIGRQTQESIKNTAHSGSSRLAWLQRQLDKK